MAKIFTSTFIWRNKIIIYQYYPATLPLFAHRVYPCRRLLPFPMRLGREERLAIISFLLGGGAAHSDSGALISNSPSSGGKS